MRVGRLLSAMAQSEQLTIVVEDVANWWMEVSE